jgi:hypothetical protein
MKDIVTQLRANSECLAPSIMLEAADTIERLREERDDARRELCRWSSFYYEEHIDINEGPPRARDREEAARRGWDCFKRKDGK